MAMTANKKTTYDEIPYTSRPFVQTHPDRLATLGHLFGLTPAPVTHCKVLELGCAGGGNLIPMAFQFPESKFIGVDLSERHVETAQQTIKDLNLKNIRIEHASILEITESWGLFDYIICHGVYSWIPAEVQDKILEISAKNLSPEGIAYVSYNTYPGWHMREMIRHMMRYHSEQFKKTDKRIEQARALIDFLAASVPTNDYYGQMLKSELNLVQRSHNWYLFHEHLEEINAPIYFHQFAERADKHNLQYLGEADFSTMLTGGFSNEIAETLNEISPNILRIEQYMDFLRNRFFRQTLLCHKEHSLNRNLGIDNLKDLKITASFKTTSPADLKSGQKQSFQTQSGQNITTNSPLTNAALSVLNDYWPLAIDQETLFQEASQRLGDSLPTEEKTSAWNTVLEDLLYCYSSKIIELHTWQADIVTKVSAKPRISQLAAFQAANSQTVVNQRHETVDLDIIAKELALVLDGTRDHNTLLDHLRNRIADGAIVIKQNGNIITDDNLLDEVLQKTFEQTLDKLAEASLLVS